MRKSPPQIKSRFAILDVESGRKALAKLMPAGSNSLRGNDRIPVVIRGHISHRHGADDGTSIEFGVDVERVVTQMASTPVHRHLEHIADVMECHKDIFDQHQIDAVREAAIMATGHKIKVGKVDKASLAKGKVQPIDSTPKPLRGVKARKAGRTVKGLKANREAKRG